MAETPSLADKWHGQRIKHAHEHPPVLNANVVHDQTFSFGDRLADAFTLMVGSWSFLIAQSIILTL
jgi:uncharacterized membrane protein